MKKGKIIQTSREIGQKIEKVIANDLINEIDPKPTIKEPHQNYKPIISKIIHKNIKDRFIKYPKGISQEDLKEKGRNLVHSLIAFGKEMQF